MKYILFCILLIFTLSVKAQEHKLVKLWETDSIIDLPESVLLDTDRHILYASQMGINPNDKDRIGGVAKISLDGKDIDTNWISGLNSPKGLGRYKDKLYAADLTDVDVIDIDESKVIKIIPIDSAKFLNDITVSDDGIVYVSDSQTHKIHRIENGIPTIYLENINGVNGLKAIGNDLYIAGGKTIWKADSKKELTKVTELPNGIDGVEPVGNGDFIYSSWGGYIYYGNKNGTNELLLDTHLEKKNSADINYDPVKHILYVPTFWKKSVAAYRLE
jgi:hypothetical protein